jgi:hypothetical protein
MRTIAVERVRDATVRCMYLIGSEYLAVADKAVRTLYFLRAADTRPPL